VVRARHAQKKSDAEYEVIGDDKSGKVRKVDAKADGSMADVESSALGPIVWQ
jgi:hypothetical protein